MSKKTRIFPGWWPLLGAASPVVLPVMLLRNSRFKRNRERAERVNRERFDAAGRLELPALESLALTVLVEQEAREGFRSDPGVSYLVETDRGRLLFDVGFGPDQPTLAHNAGQLGVTLDDVDALVISHLHLDHMGGMAASRAGAVALPEELGQPRGQPCFLPDRSEAPGFAAQLVEQPMLVGAGVATTGPLARSLFFMGWTEEQALVAHIEGAGLVLVTGCGHPTLEVLLEMVHRISDEPLHAVVGGLHLPVSESRLRRAGLQLQMLLGTGKPPWERIDEADVDRTIETLNAAGPARVLLSAHDTCDHAIARIKDGVSAEVEVLQAGGRYELGAT
jgi:7,8-dihydropterin-6-yl-methyl-4-(beta-D-ribofuranosyl)aminobenzene 5'-phosphate synthase